MYSYEDRIKAVRLYLKLGKRLGATIRQLGYPTKNNLLGWYHEHVAAQGLRAGYRHSRDKFTAEQKQHAVQHYLDQGRCMAFTLRALGYPRRQTLKTWIDEIAPDARMRMVGRAPNVQHPMETKKPAVIELRTRNTSTQEIARWSRYAGPPCTTGRTSYLAQRPPH